jgi:pilus assembly protein Flp/PilA
LGVSRVQTFCQRLLRDQSGATAIEYGLLIGLIAAAMVAGLSDFSNQLVNTYIIVSTYTNTAQAKEH